VRGNLTKFVLGRHDGKLFSKNLFMKLSSWPAINYYPSLVQQMYLRRKLKEKLFSNSSGTSKALQTRLILLQHMKQVKLVFYRYVYDACIVLYLLIIMTNRVLALKSKNFLVSCLSTFIISSLKCPDHTEMYYI